jgi:hypothetical protein
VTAATGPHDLTHAQFTDALYADIASAATAFERWAAAAPRPLVVTLHDPPGGYADPRARRAQVAGYRRVAAVCDPVVVSTQHEAVRARAVTDLATMVIALPLADPAAPAPAPVWARRSSVGVLGFLYPRQGHEQVVRAAAGTGALVVAIGAASPGHECLPDELQHLADAVGVKLLVTGPLTDGQLQAAARAVTVPFAAYRTPGASASLATWAAYGRRPVVKAPPHTLELHGANPGSVQLADDLAVAIAAGLLSRGRPRWPGRPRVPTPALRTCRSAGPAWRTGRERRRRRSRLGAGPPQPLGLCCRQGHRRR